MQTISILGSTGSIGRQTADVCRYPEWQVPFAAGVLRADPDYGSAFLDEFQDRLFFGSDICFAEMPFAAKILLDEWLAEKRISETVYRKIARDNAVRFFNLSD